MTLKAVSPALEIVNATDTYQDAIAKVYDVLDALYAEVNTLYGMDFGTVQPTAAESGLLWLDSSTSPPVLKYNAGTSGAENFQSVAASAAFGSSLGFDLAFEAYSDRMILTKSGAIVTVAATASLPATIFITDQSAGMLQNTADASVTISGTARIYDIWAQRDGSNTTFTLDFVTSGGTPSGNNYAYGQRKIGEVYWDGSEVTALRSLEIDDKTKYTTPNQLFFAYRAKDPNLNLESGTETAIPTNTTYYDLDGCEANGVFTAQKSGWYEFGASIKLSKDACTRFTLELALYRNSIGTPVATAFAVDSAGVSSTLTVKPVLNSGPMFITAGGTITFKATQTNNATSPNINDSAEFVTNANYRHDYGWWGRYIGP